MRSNTFQKVNLNLVGYGKEKKISKLQFSQLYIIYTRPIIYIRANLYFNLKICRFSSIIKTRGIRLSFEKKQKLREDLKRVKEMSRAIKERKQAEKEAKKQRRRDNIKRTEENRKKSEIVQVVSIVAYLKKNMAYNFMYITV